MTHRAFIEQQLASLGASAVMARDIFVKILDVAWSYGRHGSDEYVDAVANLRNALSALPVCRDV